MRLSPSRLARSFVAIVVPGLALGVGACTAEPAPHEDGEDGAVAVVEAPLGEPFIFTPSAVTGAGGFNNTLAFDDVVPGRVLVGGDVSGIWRSEDHGRTWLPDMLGLTSTTHRAVASLAVFGGVSFAAVGKVPCGCVPDPIKGKVCPTSAIYRRAPDNTTWEMLDGAAVAFSGSEDDCETGNTLEEPNVTGHLFAFNPVANIVFAGTYRTGIVAIVPNTCAANVPNCPSHHLERVYGSSIDDKRITGLIIEAAEPTFTRLIASYRDEGATPGGVQRLKVRRMGGLLTVVGQSAFDATLVASLTPADAGDYGPEEIVKTGESLYIAAGLMGTFRCTLRFQPTCTAVLPPAPYKNGERLGPYWTTVETKPGAVAGASDEVWFGASAWPNLGAATDLTCLPISVCMDPCDPACIATACPWRQAQCAWQGGMGAPLDASYPPELYTGVIRLKEGVLRNMVPAVSLSSRVGGDQGPQWWRVREMIQGISTASPSCVSADCLRAKTENARHTTSVATVGQLAFDPMAPDTVLATGLRRSDDDGLHWYFSNSGANGVVGHRVRYDAASGRTYASMHDWTFMESTTGLRGGLRWNRLVHAVSYATGFAFGAGRVFIALQPQQASGLVVPEIWGQVPGGADYARLLSQESHPPLNEDARWTLPNDPARWAYLLTDLAVGCTSDSCDNGLGWRLITVIGQSLETAFATLRYTANPAVGATLKIGSRQYDFVASAGAACTDVAIAADPAQTYANLTAAINACATDGVTAEHLSGSATVYLTMGAGTLPPTGFVFNVGVDTGLTACGKSGTKGWNACQDNVLAACELELTPALRCSSWSVVPVPSPKMVATPGSKLALFWPAGTREALLWNPFSGLWAGVDGHDWVQRYATLASGPNTGHAKLSKKFPHRLYFTFQANLKVLDGIDGIDGPPTLRSIPLPVEDGPSAVATALALSINDTVYVAVQQPEGLPPKLRKLPLTNYVPVIAGQPSPSAPAWQEVADDVYRSVAITVEDMEIGPGFRLIVSPSGAGFLSGVQGP